MTRRIAILIGLACVAGTAPAQSFYQSPRGLFSTRPSATASLTHIKRCGPIGIGIDLLQPAFTMRISHVEPGSPAAATGKLQAGQIIESINGQRLAAIDPRIQLGRLVAAAEASDGQVRLAIRGQAEPVVVQLPVLGAYSPTWPLDCPKSARIVRRFADYLARPDTDKGFGGIGMLFLLSTGEAKDLPPVREWARAAAQRPPTYAWHLGYGGIPLCEYYLRTGDQEVLPGLQKWVDNAVKGQYLDGWAGRGGVPSVTYGNGHLNAGGTAVVTFLLLAKECGVNVPDHALLGALVHFFRYAGRGNNPYGDHRPELGFVDNGKNGNLAFAMAAAAALTPDGEDSVYARARDVCALTSFYTTSFMLHGHTGGGIGEAWRSPAMGLLYHKRPQQYREFMDHRQWHYELSRRFDGSFGILGGGGYDEPKWRGGWGTAYALTYTIPRRTLRITGAPPTEFSKRYQLPKQPWGTAADNAFLSLEAVPDADGKRRDLTGETLAADASMAVLHRLHGAGPVSDAVLRRYLYHQDHNIRFVAANEVLGVHSGYIGWRSRGGQPRPALMMAALRAQDPRVRRAMFAALVETVRREQRRELLTGEVFELAVAAVRDPQESWWVKDAALQVIGLAAADRVAPQVDLLLPYLQHADWWLQNAALTALTPVVADPRCYQRVLPAIGELVRTNQRSALTLGLMGGIRTRIQQGPPAVHRLAAATLKETYTGYAGVKTAPGGQDISSTLTAHLEFIAASLADVPGGLDVLFEVARARFPNEPLPYKKFFLDADPAQLGPKLKQALTPIILDELIPEYVGRNRQSLRKLAANQVQSPNPGGQRDTIDPLAALYERAGVQGYGWRMFADLRAAEWSYHSFDPIAAEQVPWDQLITRYRPVTLPAGMAGFFEPGFDPAKAGWQQGKSPFGQYRGALPEGPFGKCSAECTGPDCFGGTPVRTLWDKEVLLLRGTFAIPKLKPGHRYRLRVNDGDHVGSGGGHILYVNGRPLIEQKTCGGRGSGGQPKGAYITEEFLADFRRGEVTIAVMTFLRFNDKYKVKPTTRVPQGKFSLHLEEMKLPPMGDDLVRKSATVVPMRTAAWQAAQQAAQQATQQADQQADSRELQDRDARFVYDGRFVANPPLVGAWHTVAVVPSIDAYDPGKRPRGRRGQLDRLVLRDGGDTDSPTRIWSGDRLLDLERYEALQMELRTIDGAPHLFVEVGGFNPRHKAGWQSSWYVMKRQTEERRR